MDDPSLLFLSQIRENLEHADFDMIKRSIADLRWKHAPIALLHKGGYIDRARINYNGEIFTRKDQISYITDPNVLEKYVYFGRANFPNQAVFYGAIPSPQIRYPRATAYLETTCLFENKPLPDNVSEVFTLGRWKILKDIEAVEMIFSDEALKVSDYAKRSFQSQLDAIQTHNRKDHFIAQGKFFSNEFARTDCKKASYNYKISSAYANYVWDNTPVKGITYPSVRTDYQGQNVVLLPQLVDNLLQLELVVMFKFERVNGSDQQIDSIKLANDLGLNQSDFQWHEYVGKDQLV